MPSKEEIDVVPPFPETTVIVEPSPPSFNAAIPPPFSTPPLPPPLPRAVNQTDGSRIDPFNKKNFRIRVFIFSISLNPNFFSLD